MKYTVYLEMFGADQQLVEYPDGDDETCVGYDDTVKDAKPKWYENLKEAKESAEYSDEYVTDENGDWIYRGESCIDCRGFGNGKQYMGLPLDNDFFDKKTGDCLMCHGTGKSGGALKDNRMIGESKNG